MKYKFSALFFSAILIQAIKGDNMPETMVASEQKMTSKAETSHKPMSSVSDLIKKSWETVKLVWKKLLIISVILWAVIFGLIVVGAGVFGGIFVTASISSGEQTASAIAMAIIMAVIAVIVFLVVASVLGTSMLLAVNEAESDPPVGTLISRGFKLFLPVFLTSLMAMFLIYGGLILFVIPGIIIAVLTGLTMYEVVLTENKYSAALSNSVKIVSQNFGEIVIRVLVVIGLAFGLFLIQAMLSGMMGENGAAQGAFGLVWSLVQAVFGWFVMCYYLLMYKEARANTDFTKRSSILWMWIVSALGWVLGIFMFGAIATALSNMDWPGLMNVSKTEDQEFNYEMLDDTTGQPELDADQLLDQYGQDMTEEEKEQFKLMMEKAENTMMIDENAAVEEEQL